jgi:endonuclease YncB( thermonuclease family)
MLDGNERVRLIGVDTPETVHPNKPVERFGKEASAFTTKLVQGKRVRMEYDWQRTDKYGRTLGYVYLEDGRFVNAEIIKQGYGFAYVTYPFSTWKNFVATSGRLEMLRVMEVTLGPFGATDHWCVRCLTGASIASV